MSISARTIQIFRRQRKEINAFLQSNNSVSRTNYYRIFALASIDVALTLPIGIANIALISAGSVISTGSVAEVGHLIFYQGWTAVHADWEPLSFSYEDLIEDGTPTVAQFYFSHWTSPVLAFAIFGLFGVNKEARASYWRALRTVLGWFGWTPAFLAGTANSTVQPMEFGEPPQNTSVDPDTG